jgi:ubiquinone/menaquinone biosynthesis C-methylase UbiE
MSRALLVLVMAALPFVAFGQSPDDKTTCRIIYVPTPQTVVDKMLEMVKVNRNDVVYDLGCGDGRIVCTAAKKYGAQGVGVDIDADRIKDSVATMRKIGVTADQVEFRQGDALKVKDLEKATVIVFYMLPEFMEKLEPQVMKRLRPGTRLIAHDFPLPNLKPDATVQFEGPDRPHWLYMWTIKEPKK